MAQSTIAKKSSGKATSRVAVTPATTSKKKMYVVIASLFVFVLLGLLGGILYYYVTYGELPMLTNSSAGEVSAILPIACRAKLLTGSNAATIKKAYAKKICPAGQTWSDGACGCLRVCNTLIACKDGTILDNSTCKCVPYTFDVVSCTKPVKICTIHYKKIATPSNCVIDSNGQEICPMYAMDSSDSTETEVPYVSVDSYNTVDRTFESLGGEAMTFKGGTITCAKSNNPPTVRLSQSETENIKRLKTAGWECKTMTGKVL
jgi:hypothetical protein